MLHLSFFAYFLAFTAGVQENALKQGKGWVENKLRLKLDLSWIRLCFLKGVETKFD